MNEIEMLKLLHVYFEVIRACYVRCLDDHGVFLQLLMIDHNFLSCVMLSDVTNVVCIVKSLTSPG